MFLLLKKTPGKEMHEMSKTEKRSFFSLLPQALPLIQLLDHKKQQQQQLLLLLFLPHNNDIPDKGRKITA